MPQLLCANASLRCTFGTTPSNLLVLPAKRVNLSSMPAATITDCIPMTNIMPFGMCTTLSNPTVASATSLAGGVLTPQPCIPVTSPWTPGVPTTLIGGTPAVNNTCTCMCAWGGVISPSSAGQTKTNG